MKKLITLLIALMLSSFSWAQTILISPTGVGGFESGSDFTSNGWTTVNDATNKWFVGTVSTPSAGTNAAFISNDNGVTYAYTIAGTQVSYFYRDITVPAGETTITLSFKWKNNGEAGAYDRVFVYTAPTTSIPVANSTTVTGSTDITGTATYLVLQTTYQTATYTLPAALAGTTFRLIFGYKNDISGGSQPPASVDEISLISRAPSPMHGIYTINNTLPTTSPLLHNGTDKFNSFTAAINYMNGDGINAAVTLNVAAGQTFNEKPPAITATGTVANTITFQKSGAGNNPKITPVGVSITSPYDFGMCISGGDYITWDGIDIDASGATSTTTAIEYGFLIRGASTTNGAWYNTIKNCSITLNKNYIYSTYGVGSCIYSSTSSSQGGYTPGSAAGANSYNKYYNLTLQNAQNGIYLSGYTTYPDLSCEIGVSGTGCQTARNTITNIGGVYSFSAAYGIYSYAQSGNKIFNTDISAIAGNQASGIGIYFTTCMGNNEIYNNNIQNISVMGSTTTTSVVYGMRVDLYTTGTNNVRIYNNTVANVFTSYTSTATVSRYAFGMFVGVASASTSQSYDIDNNSISIGQGLTPTYSNACFELQNGSPVLKFRGNIFANYTNAQTGVAKHFGAVVTAAGIGGTGSVLDYNDYYIAYSAGTSGHVGRNGSTSTNYNAIADWKTFTTGTLDETSISVDPVFSNNNSNLHATAAGVNAVSGFSTQAWVTTDMDCNDRSTTTPSDIGADAFNLASCGLPTGLTASNITYVSADLSWTAPAIGTPASYEWEVRSSGAAGSGATGLMGSGTTTAPTVSASVSGLSGGSTYTLYVRTFCGGSDYSVWASNTFTTLSCNIPTAVASSLVTNNSATISWTAPAVGSPAGYEWEVRSSGVAGSGATGLASSGTTTSPTVTANVSSLTATTTYSVYVRTKCYTGFYSSWTTAVTFTTSCNPETAPTVVQDFSTYTGSAPAPTCWSEATGVLAASTTLTGTTSKWTSSTGFANTGSNVGVKTNLYSTYNDWIISQPIDLGSTPGLFRLKYDMAVTNYNGVVAQSTLGTHRVDVVVSTNGGATWSNTNIVKTYTGAGTYSNTGQTETVNLTGYSGVVKIAFVQTTTATTPDIDFHIDNFQVELAPSCLEPSGLSVASITTNSATINWSASASNPSGGYNIYYSTSATAPTSGTTPSGSVGAGITTFPTGTVLSPATKYYVWVRSNCGGSVYSAWSSVVNFTTLCDAVSSYPWSENFDAMSAIGNSIVPICWKVESGSGTPWASLNAASTTYNDPSSAPYYIGCNYSPSATDKYLITPAFNLTAGNSYDLGFRYAGDGYTGWSLDARINTTQTGTGSTLLGTAILTSANPPTTYTAVTRTFYPATSGTYYFVIHVNSTSAPYSYLGLDDFTLTETPIPAPKITSLGSLAGCVGTSLVINGTDLGGASLVTIGGTPAVVTVNTTTSITVTVGTGTTGYVEVTTPGGMSTSEETFTVNQIPTAYTMSGGGTYCAGGTGVSFGLNGSQTGVDYILSTTPTTTLPGTGSALTFGPSAYAAGTYTIQASDPTTGCALAMTGNASVSINTSPTGVTASANPVALCSGNPINLTSSYTSLGSTGMGSYTATRTTGTSYTSIIPATNVTSWRNAVSTDDNLSDNQPIGFNFGYNGTAYSTFRVSTNGFLTFDNASTSTGSGSGNPYSYGNSWTVASGGLVVAPNWDDLQTAGNLGTLTDLNN
ncbi:MAG: fibronectin type III domain-containing protein, partial [Bacteroidota bacterium]